MRKIWTTFARKRKAMGERAAQLTTADRRTLATPGVAPGPLPFGAYAQMQQDAMVQTCLTLKRLGALAAPYRIEPSDDSAEAARRAEFAREAFARMEGSPSTILDGAMEALASGWSVQELVWTPGGGRIWLQSVKPKNPELFGIVADPYGTIQALTLRVPGEPEIELPREKFVLYAHRGGYGRPKGTSDLDAAYPHWRAKQGLLASWRLHLDRFASPTVLAKVARTAPALDHADLLANLADLANRTAIVFPDDVAVETLASRGEGSGAYAEAVDFHNREIARAILGQTLTTDEGRRVGSLSLGKVHLQVLLLQLEALRRDLADRVMGEQVLRPLIELNFGPGPAPRFAFEPVGLSAFATGELSD